MFTATTRKEPTHARLKNNPRSNDLRIPLLITSTLDPPGFSHAFYATAMDSDCGSPDPDSARVAAGLRISPNGADPATTAADLSDDLSPSPSSQRPDSLSPSPEMGHRRSETQRMRDVLSTIDGLMMEAEQPDEEEDALANLAVSPRGRSVRGYKRQSTGAHLDSFSGSGAGRASRLSLHTPPPRDDEEGGREGDDDSRAFFSSERGWRVSPFAATPPPELAKRRASVIPAAPGADEEDDPAAVDMLLAEVGVCRCGPLNTVFRSVSLVCVSGCMPRYVLG